MCDTGMQHVVTQLCPALCHSRGGSQSMTALNMLGDMASIYRMQLKRALHICRLATPSLPDCIPGPKQTAECLRIHGLDEPQP
ncbi:hypothetical protein FKM82_002849 [Ascaphus truei]